jgi:hypothetical protein
MRHDDRTPLLRERRRGWWVAVLAGPVDEPYPVPGAEITATLDGDTLKVAGTLPTEEDRRALQEDVRALRAAGVARVELDLAVVPEAAERPATGGWRQTLVATFESAGQAHFAADWLRGQGQLQSAELHLVDPEAPDTLRGLLPAEYVDDVLSDLAAGRAVLIVTVDEADAFQARELLDEDTRSLQTVVLPPVGSSEDAPGAGPAEERPPGQPRRPSDG